MTFDEAWKIVKEKGPVQIESVQLKVYRAYKIVKPHLLDWEHMHLVHEMQGHGRRPETRRRGFDIVAKVIDDRIYKGIEFKGPL